MDLSVILSSVVISGLITAVITIFLDQKRCGKKILQQTEKNGVRRFEK